MTAADRQTVSKLVAGDVIHVEREASGLLRSTTRKTKTIHATVTGRDSAPAGEFQQRGRFIVRTDQGDTISVPGHQTFGLVKGAGAPTGEVPAVEVPSWNEYDTWREYALAGDQDAPTRGDMKPRTETFRGRRLKVTRGASWGTIDMTINGAPAGNTYDSSPAAMDRAAEQLRRDVLAADERRVIDPDAYPAVWFKGATELPPAIVAYVRDRAQREERDRSAMAATSCSDVEHVPGVMGCPLSLVDCNAVPFAADTIDVHEVRESTGMLGFHAAGLEVRAALVAQLPEVGALSTGETGWDHKRIRRAAVWQLPIGSHLVTFVHYEGRTAVAEAASFIAVLVDGRMVEGAGAVSAARRPAELSRFLAWTIASALRTLDDAPAAVPAVEAPAAGDQGEASGDVETSGSVDEDGPDVDMCPDCGEDAYAPHSPDGDGRPCPSDPDTVTYADALAAAQGDEAPAVPTVDGVPAGTPYVTTLPAGWPAVPVRIESKQVSKILRTEFLPAWFPGVKFSVRLDSGSMYVGADISWTDGPSDQVVSLVADMWRGKFYDGQSESTGYRGAVLYVNAAGEAVAYDLPGISINTHRDVSVLAVDKATEFLRDVPAETLAQHSTYVDPFGRPWFGGSVQDCARWLAAYGVDRDTRDMRGYAPVDRGACPVDRCALAAGHRWSGVHRDHYGRAFFGTVPESGDGDQGGGGIPVTPSPDDSPAPAAPSFSTWQELADHIRPGRTRLLLAGAGEQGDLVDAEPIEAPAPVVPASVGVALAVVNNGLGSIRVHKPGCRDIEREAAGGTWWELSSPDVRGVVVDLYGNGDFEGFTLDTWRDWSGDVEVMPCVGTLPDVADNAPAAPAGDVTPAEAETSGTGDLVPASAVVRPQLGDQVSVSGWSGVSAFVLSVQQDTVGGWDTGETLRFPVGNVTAVTVPTLGDMRHTARLVLDSTARAVDIVEPARAILTTPTWESGTPKAGEGVRAVALNTTDGKRLDDVELLAHTVTKLGCGCWRIECHRPGPVQDGHRSTVALHTGCHRHDAQVSVPLPNADELAAARLAGREAHTLGVPAHIFTTSDERIGSTFKRLPVGSAVYSALITSYHEGYEQAAEHAVESAGYAAINTAGAEPAARNLEVRTAELAEAREVLAGDHTDKPAGSAIMDEVFAGLRAAVAAKSPADDSAAGPATTSVAAPDVRRTYKPQPWVLAHLAGGAGESGTPSEQEQQPTPAVVEAPPAAGDQVEGDEATSWAEFYTLTVEDYAPELPSDEADEHGTLITITHNHEDGTTLDGSSKGDGVYEIAHAHGFTYRSHAGIFIQGSRDRFSRLTALAKLGAALREAGHRVAFDIDDVWRPTAVREEARAERVSERVERLSARAGRKFGEGNGRRAAAEAIGDRMPFGEPIKVGHHSERAHRRAFERIDTNYRAAYAAYDYAEHLTNRAEGAEANEEAKNRSRAIMRRIERIETDQRKYVRELGKLMESDPANRSAYRRRLRLEIERIAEEVAYQRAKLGDRAATGEFVAWSKGDFRKDDFANIGGTWCKVVRANAKTLSVENRYGWGGNGTAPYDKVFGRRRDGMQWDAPNAEPWSVEEARKAAKWEALTVRARRAHPGDGDQLAEAANQGRALRIVLGMAKDSGTAEVDAYGEPTDQDGKRRRALAAWDVYERLTAGETFEQIAATIEPLGDSTPRWVMPEGEPQDVRVTDLVVGDVVVGIWDSGFAGSRSRLIYSMEGPVTSAPVTYDRYESGEWATFEVDGNSHDVKTFRLVSAHLVGDRN